MASKTSLLEAVKAFDWQAVDAALSERPDLLTHREPREKNWLHVLCSTPLKGRKPAHSIKTADVLLKGGIDLHAHAFTEGKWKATPVWWCISWGRNLALAEHLLKLGATPDYSMFAACWNDDVRALDLLLKYGAVVDDLTSSRETPFLGAIAWSRFAYAKALLERGADVNARTPDGVTAFHLMLKKGSDFEHVATLAKIRCAGRRSRTGWEDRHRDHVPQEGRAIPKTGGETGCAPVSDISGIAIGRYLRGRATLAA